MATTSPVFCICGTEDDREFIAQLHRSIQSRGLGLTPLLQMKHASPEIVSQEQALIEKAEIVFVIISYKNVREPEIIKKYRYSLHLHKTVIPIIRQKVPNPPKDLVSLQWLDFTGEWDVGFDQFLIILDSKNVTLWPKPEKPVFDPEIIRAKYRSGRTEPSWRVVQKLTPTFKFFTLTIVLYTLFMFGITIISVFFDIHYQAGVIVNLIVYFFMVIYLSVSVGIYQENSKTLIITPLGFLYYALSDGQSFDFSDYSNIILQKGKLFGKANLILTAIKSGNQITYELPQILLEMNHIGDIILQYYQVSKNTNTIQDNNYPYIFISYAHKNMLTAQIITQNLIQTGVPIWMDRMKLIGGSAWLNEIQKGIENAQAVLLIVTPDSMKSKTVQQEYAYAIQLGKPIIPVLAKNTSNIPDELKKFQFVDFRKHVYDALTDLYFVLNSLGLLYASNKLQSTFDFNVFLTMAYAKDAQNLPSEWRLFTSISMYERLKTVFLGIIAISPILFDLLTVASWFWKDIYSVIVLSLLIRSIQQKKVFGRYSHYALLQPNGAVLFFQKRINEFSYAKVQIVKYTISPFGVYLYFRLNESKVLQQVRLSDAMGEKKKIVSTILSDYQKYAALHPKKV